MTAYYLNSKISGFSFNSNTTTLDIGAEGYVVGVGLSPAPGTGGSYTINNAGRVNATTAHYGGLNFSNSHIYLINGSVNNTVAVIEGQNENNVDYGIVKNFGSILTSSATYAGLGTVYAILVNGAVNDTRALIQGGVGVSILKSANVVNYAQILGEGSMTNVGTVSQLSAGVYAGYGGTVTNGSATDTNAIIRGADGIYFGKYYFGGAFGSVSNFGTIESNPFLGYGVGVDLEKGGAVTNGSASDQGALIQGAFTAIQIKGGAGAVTNGGVITTEEQGFGSAIVLQDGGSVTNGASNNFKAVISGGTGVEASGASTTVANFGQIEGGASYFDVGVSLGAGGSVTNGSTSDTGAGISCYGDGVRISGGAGTVNNSGTISSGYVYSVSLGDGGRVTNGSTIDKTALLEGGRGVQISGAVGDVSNFGTIRAENYGYSGGYAGVQLQTSGDKLVNGSTADKTALVTGYKGVTVAAGAVVVNYGTIAGSVSGVSLGGADAKLEAESGSTVAGAVANTGGVVDVVSGVGTITGGLTSSGVLEGAGTLALTGGTSTIFAGSKLDVAAIAVSGASTIVQVETKINDAEVWKQSAGQLTVASGDEIALSGKGNSFAGTIGGAGVLEITGGTDTFNNVVLTIAKVAVTSGTLTLTGSTNVAGKTEISGAVVNSGTLAVTGGELTVTGAVSGAGIVDINGGVADFESTFSQNFYFLGTTGILELAKSQSYTGTISGLSKTGSNSLYLNDIAYGASTKATYSGTSTSGTLTVTDGTHTAKIKLTGNFNTSTFTVSSDGHGGTKVIDPAKAPPHAFIAAMAGLGAGGSGALTSAMDPWRQTPPTLAAPG